MLITPFYWAMRNPAAGAVWGGKGGRRGVLLGVQRSLRAYTWDDMQKRTFLALDKGTLKGVLWHQGEADSKKEKVVTYEKRLHDLIKRIRKTFHHKKLPFIAGTLGNCWVAWNKEGASINQIISSLPQKTPFIALVDTSDLPCNEDKTHFNTEALRLLGMRYAEAFLKLQIK